MMDEWISVKDRMPQNGTCVLTLCYGYDFLQVLSYDHGFNCCRLPDGTLYKGGEIKDVEYWMPVPELPAQREVA